MKVCAIILAAGQGKRMKMQGNKIFIRLQNKKSLLYYTLRVFEQSQPIDSIIIVARREEIELYKEIASDFQKVVKIVPGGKTRQESSYNGVMAALGYDIVVIHDGARPFVDQEIVNKSVAEAMHYGACVVAVPEKNTIKELDEEGFIYRTLDRNRLWSIQTPQTFQYDLILNAHKSARENNINAAVDDSVLVERAAKGTKIRIIQGSYENIKITTQDDLKIAMRILDKDSESNNRRFRIGFGIDSHRFDKNKKDLILGGIKISGCNGLEANSDGDVISHAIFNAISGAIGMGSIGKYADKMCKVDLIKDSTKYLSFIANEMNNKGYRINNLAIMLEAKIPQIDPFVNMMKERLAQVLTINEDQIGICATSGEEIDAFGQGRGIKCSCTASLVLR